MRGWRRDDGVHRPTTLSALRSRLAIGAAAVALALPLAGCGGDDEEPASDEDQITEVVQETYAAYGEGDGETFCANLSAEYLPDYEDYYGSGEGSCEETVAAVPDELTAEQLGELEEVEVTDVEVEDGEAYPTVFGEGLEVVDEDGEWKLDDFDYEAGG